MAVLSLLIIFSLVHLSLYTAILLSWIEPPYRQRNGVIRQSLRHLVMAILSLLSYYYYNYHCFWYI